MTVRGLMFLFSLMAACLAGIWMLAEAMSPVAGM